MNFENIKVGDEVILGNCWNYAEGLKESRIGIVVHVTAQRFVHEYQGVKSLCLKGNGQKRGWKGHWSAICLNTSESIQQLKDEKERDRLDSLERDRRIEVAKALTEKLKANWIHSDVNGYGSSFSVELQFLTETQVAHLVEMLAGLDIKKY